ncbi:Ligand-gated ion channel, partial [Ancylostoma duodenale]
LQYYDFVKNRPLAYTLIPQRLLSAKIARLSKFNYTIHEVKDKAYGIREENGKWNGMVGELINGEADLAVASLTISYSRSEVIDFTVPYMHLGISILFKGRGRSVPFVVCALFTLVGSLTIRIGTAEGKKLTRTNPCRRSLLNRSRPISPFEKVVHNNETGNWDKVDNQFSFRNAFWFTVCSLMQQVSEIFLVAAVWLWAEPIACKGSELSPRAPSTRVATAVWWFFAMILISSYTANLAAFLTTQRMLTPIENADDLSSQTKIKYGTLGRGSTMSFFNESKIETYERMWKLMSSNPSLFVDSSKEGIARVKSSDYAYLMESSMLEFAVERDCELMQVGGLLDQKGYGIGLPKVSYTQNHIFFNDIVFENVEKKYFSGVSTLTLGAFLLDSCVCHVLTVVGGRFFMKTGKEKQTLYLRVHTSWQGDSVAAAATIRASRRLAKPGRLQAETAVGRR